MAGDDDSETPEHFVSNKEPGGGAPYGRLLFHSDMMWHESPFQVLTLYGVDVEQPAVPTIFANTAYAWDSLPDDLRARVDGLHALHITGQQARGGDDDEELLQPIREQAQMATTSVGHRHPRTGRTLLYVSQMMTREIVELPPDESEALLEELFAHLYDPAHIVAARVAQRRSVCLGQHGDPACTVGRADRRSDSDSAQGGCADARAFGDTALQQSELNGAPADSLVLIANACRLDCAKRLRALLRFETRGGSSAWTS